MFRVGLTGGIGAGKSEVSKRLGAQGAIVVDADLIAREVVAPGRDGFAAVAEAARVARRVGAAGTDGFAAVVEAFGSEVLGPDGALDRSRLGDIVFADK